MGILQLLTILAAACQLVHAHGHDEPKDGETPKEYAMRHMITEHHIDAFDLKSFFALHDLDSNGVLDAAEIEAIYGVHHLDSQKKSPDDETHALKAKQIVQAVLAKMDTNKDGFLTPEEFEAAGFEGLPDFSFLGAEGHHYDEESEFFLHHEEMYHNTPETQTDEAYSHPEDIEHFGSHERIERDEENKERAFQGLPPLGEGEQSPSHDHDHEAEAEAPPVPNGAKFTRLRDEADPKRKFASAGQEAKSKPEWGQGDEGYKRPKTPADKLRRNVPYKYKFRRSFGDF